MSAALQRLTRPAFAVVLLTIPGTWTAAGARLGRAVHAAVADSTLLKTYRWRNIGPDRGGRSIAVSGVKGRPKEAYFGATGGGLYKSTDGGKSWRKVLYRDPNTAAIDISIDRTNPDVMYAAMWEAYRKEYTMSSGGPGSGLFKSTDGGEHWNEITRNPGMPAG